MLRLGGNSLGIDSNVHPELLLRSMIAAVHIGFLCETPMTIACR